MKDKIAIFFWGEISIHACNLAKQLHKEGFEIALFLYTPKYAYKNIYSRTLLSELKSSKINVIELKCTKLEEQFIKLNRITIFLKIPWLNLLTNIFLPKKTTNFFKSDNYKYIISVTHFSLFWLYKTEAASLKKTLYYSLEIHQTTDPGTRKNSWHYAIINKEAKLLSFVKALIIQDKLRAQELLKNTSGKNDIDVIYLPVSIHGETIKNKSNYLYEMFNLQKEKKIILYFGAEYKERKLEELIESFSQVKNPELILVIHGAGELKQIDKPVNVRVSNVLVEYDRIHEIISSATIGIALYDISWPNTRLTAFSSEKIARYLQTGVPFIAFKNESYDNLKNEFNCCELIEDMNELENALITMMNDYETYRNNCFLAYNKYYNISNSIKPLINYLHS